MIGRILLCDIDGTEHELGIRDGRFTDPEAADGRSIDVRHLTGLPGLVDAHAHLTGSSVRQMVTSPRAPDFELTAANARAQLAAGVQVVADKGGRSDEALRFLDTDPAARPDLHMAGAILMVSDGYFADYGRVVDPDDLSGAVRDASKHPAEWIKLIGDWPRRGRGALPNFSEEQLAAGVKAAHAAGRRVAIHTMAPEVPTWAVRAGVDSIEHGLFLTADDVTALGRRHGAWVPTVSAMEDVLETLGRDSSGGRLIAQGLSNLRELLPGAAAAGVIVMGGTDLSLPHGAVAREAVRLAEYGVGAADVVRGLTSGGFDYLGSQHGFRPGRPANLVCVAGDPREDLRLLLEPQLVMRLGHVVSGVTTRGGDPP